MRKSIRTREEAKEDLIRKGISISAWAKEHGFNRTLVHSVLDGARPCRFGQSHKVAVLLGIKEGEIAR